MMGKKRKITKKRRSNKMTTGRLRYKGARTRETVKKSNKETPKMEEVFPSKRVKEAQKADKIRQNLSKIYYNIGGKESDLFHGKPSDFMDWDELREVFASMSYNEKHLPRSEMLRYEPIRRKVSKALNLKNARWNKIYDKFLNIRPFKPPIFPYWDFNTGKLRQ